MRTILNLPEELFNEAMKATRITKTKVIITALEELIRNQDFGVKGI